MPRTARSIIGGHCYHLINRGNNKGRVFHEASDYSAFLTLLHEVRERVPIAIFAACLMPNHLHFVVQPKADDDLARWTHWLFTTHVRRQHRKYGTSGRIWQGRFKAFAIQEDAHLLTVLRYVERNALRADLVRRAEHWRWGSLYWRINGEDRVVLDPPPLPLPGNWPEYVNRPQSSAETDAIHTCINRQRPYGARDWVERKAREFGADQSLAPLGRPSKRR